MESKKKSFLNGAAILAVAGILCKVIGAVYKIPLRNAVGPDTMGVYSSVYPIYTFLLIFSTSGIPTAISKLVAEERSKGNYKNAHKVFLSSLSMLAVIGAVTTVLMLVGSGVISDILRIESWQPVAFIAPSLLFVSLLSAYRGYYQGMQNMTPTALTQIIEQIIKLIAGFIFAIGFYKKYGYVMGAAGALLGITISEAVAFAVIWIMYQRNKASFLTLAEKNEEQGNPSTYVKRLLQIAVPMTIGGAIKPLVDAIDSVMIKSILERDLSYSIKYIDELYGFLKSDCGTLINMPTVLTVALSMALVPAISDALANGSNKEVKRISATGLKLSLVIGLPCTVGFFTMAEPILSLLYVYADETFEEGLFTQSAKLGLTGTFLMILSFGVLFLAVIQTAAGILQGVGKVTIPVINLGIGMVVKIIMNLILVPNADINIIGVPIGTVTCYAIAAVLDVIFVLKYTHFSLSFRDDILRPVGASAIMAAVVILLKLVLKAQFAQINTFSKLLTIAVIGIAATVYFIGLAIFSVFDESDIELMPGGKKLKKLLIKAKVKIRPERQ